MPRKIEQPTWKATRKVAYGPVGGAIGTLLVTGAVILGADITVEQVALMTGSVSVLSTFALQYLLKDTDRS